MGRPWTDPELNVLRTRYGTHGPTYINNQINRTFTAITDKASQMGLEFGLVTGWVAVSEIANYLGFARNTVREAAYRHSELIKLCGGTRAGSTIVLVPRSWADEYISNKEDDLANDELVDHYYSLDTTAKAFGVSRRLLFRWFKRKNSPLKDVRRYRTSGRHRRAWLFHPWDVEQAAKEYRNE